MPNPLQRFVVIAWLAACLCWIDDLAKVSSTRPVAVDIDTSRTFQISPLIYGSNFPDWKTMAGRITFTRWGGNRTTAYNWENNASNAGADWHHQNDDLMGKSD